MDIVKSDQSVITMVFGTKKRLVDREKGEASCILSSAMYVLAKAVLKINDFSSVYRARARIPVVRATPPFSGFL